MFIFLKAQYYFGISTKAFCIVFTYICILSDILPYLILAQIVFSGALHRHSLT